MTLSLLAIVVLAAACERQMAHPGPPSPVTAAPSSLAISVADLPQGWAADPTATGTITRAKFGDSSDDSNYRDHGWSSAYEADFTFGGDGNNRIAILIHEFNDVAGTKSFFIAGIGAQRGELGRELTNPPAFGQDSYDFAQNLVGKTMQFWFYWIDRNILVRMLVEGPQGSITRADATDLAQRQAQMIQRH